MTLEELTSDPSISEKMSDAELYAFFEPYLKVTRPELQEHKSERKMTSVKTHLNISKEKKDKINLAKHLAEQLGLKLPI